jgi:hypothetical protein
VAGPASAVAASDKDGVAPSRAGSLGAVPFSIGKATTSTAGTLAAAIASSELRLAAIGSGVDGAGVVHAGASSALGLDVSALGAWASE